MSTTFRATGVMRTLSIPSIDHTLHTTASPLRPTASKHVATVHTRHEEVEQGYLVHNGRLSFLKGEPKNEDRTPDIDAKDRQNQHPFQHHFLQSIPSKVSAVYHS